MQSHHGQSGVATVAEMQGLSRVSPLMAWKSRGPVSHAIDLRRPCDRLRLLDGARIITSTNNIN